MIRARFFYAFAFALASLSLIGCVSTGFLGKSATTQPQDTQEAREQQDTAPQQNVRVAMLVPQSGPNAAIGHALLQAAQLAVFDVNAPNFELITKDTKSTPAGTRAAVIEAAHEGAKLILGPLFASNVEAARDAARPYGLSVIGFSTDWRVAGDNIYTMGVLPFEQVRRIGDFAARQGFKRIGIVASNDMYGEAVVALFKNVAVQNGTQITKIVRIAPDGADAGAAAQTLINAVAPRGAAPLVDALFMPVGGQAIHILAATLKTYGLDSARVPYLGTGLWDDMRILGDANMQGAFYAAPAPQTRATFEQNYKRIYGAQPPRLASIGYDAAALAIVLARNAAQQGTRVAYSRETLLNPNGFAGVDGIFRFHTNGLIERGMAVLQISGGRAHVVEAAPSSFVGEPQ